MSAAGGVRSSRSTNDFPDDSCIEFPSLVDVVDERVDECVEWDGGEVGDVFEVAGHASTVMAASSTGVWNGGRAGDTRRRPCCQVGFESPLSSRSRRAMSSSGVAVGVR